jgi:lysophospholipase
MTTSLRGELTRPNIITPSQPDKNFDKIHNVLSEFVRLLPSVPQPSQITLSPDPKALTNTSKQTAAPWTSTAGDIANTESVLLPFLIRLAASKNDIAGLKFCLDIDAHSDSGGSNNLNIAGGLVNCHDPSTGQTPLHVASLNGSTECADILLRSGALVHLRDALGHTALYYVCYVFHDLNP